MPRHNTPLDRLEVAAPCSADWDSMIGNEQVRFCEHCQKSVHNLSEMTVRQALDVVARSGGRLCVRYNRGKDGAFKSVTPLHQITRRATRFAAGAFSAALTLCSTVAAQTQQQANNPSITSVVESQAREKSRQPESAGGGSASLIGNVTDPQGAVVPGARHCHE